MPVFLELAPDIKIKAIIDDLSKDGFRLRSRAVLHVGQSVTLHLPREAVACELCWVDGLEAGGVFREAAEAPRW